MNPRSHNYEDYGGRGIAVCDRWNSFEAFLADVGRRPSDKHEIDRIDVNGNYEPGNVRWVTRDVQVNNRRNSQIGNCACWRGLPKYAHGICKRCYDYNRRHKLKQTA